VSPSVQLAASEIGQVRASESSPIQIAGVVSETVVVSTSEQATTQVQFSAVESVTQIEAETVPFVGLIQRLMIPVSVDLLKAVELSISITQVSLDLGID
jgi:type II secretory pathway component PulM